MISEYLNRLSPDLQELVSDIEKKTTLDIDVEVRDGPVDRAHGKAAPPACTAVLAEYLFQVVSVRRVIRGHRFTSCPHSDIPVMLELSRGQPLLCQLVPSRDHMLVTGEMVFIISEYEGRVGCTQVPARYEIIDFGSIAEKKPLVIPVRANTVVTPQAMPRHISHTGVIEDVMWNGGVLSKVLIRGFSEVLHHSPVVKTYLRDVGVTTELHQENIGQGIAIVPGL